MKRPLFVVAVVSCSVLWLLDLYGLFESVFRPPSFRTQMEAYRSDFVSGELTGTVKFARSNGEKYVLTVRSGREYGTVNVYYGADSEEVSDLLGRTVTFSGSFFLYRKATNFGEFSVREYYDAIGIPLAFSADRLENVSGSGNVFRRTAFRIREFIRRSIVESSNKEDAGFFLSALLSDHSAESEEERNAYQFFGFSSILSYSGFLASALGYSLYRFLRRKTGKKKLSAAISAASLLFYGGITGFSAAFLRASIVSLLRIGSSIAKRKFDLLSAASLSVLLLLPEYPGIVKLPAFPFWTAIAFALGIALPMAENALFTVKKPYTQLIRIEVTHVFLLPVIVSSSYSTSIASVVLSGFFYAMKLPMCIVLALGVGSNALKLKAISAVFFRIASLFHSLIEFLVTVSGRIPLLFRTNGYPSRLRFFLYFAAVFLAMGALRLFLIKRKTTEERKEKRATKKSFRCAAAALFVFLIAGSLFLSHDRLSRSAVSVTMMDVGQGDGFFLQTRGSSVLIDGGSTSRDDVCTVIETTVRYYGIDSIDCVFLSHGDADHVSGIVSLLETRRLRIGTIYLPEIREWEREFEQVIAAASGTKTEILTLSKGDSVSVGELSFQVLAPARNAAVKGNDASMVLSASFRETDMLFTGDASAEIERNLEITRNYELLKISHHGSKYSSDGSFLSKAAPMFALVSYDKNNSYGHPSEQALERVRSANENVSIFETGKNGAVTLVFSGSSVSVSVP